jgi:acetylornithine deacetylase/succinyl-diaminopimelate desuccinylase-like protein
MATTDRSATHRQILMDDIRKYIDDEQERFVEDLKRFLRLQSVSADSAYEASVRACADQLSAHLGEIGLASEVLETDGHPVVYGEWLGAGDAPTVLIYGHYDVQPPDPLDQWETAPFKPIVRDGALFARGATDDKGQMLCHVKAAEAHLKVRGRLPVNVKFVIEGEEEVGSPNLEPFLDREADRLGADIVAISDTSQFDRETPAITYGLRGLVYMEVFLDGPAADLHSGSFGGTVANPANVLAETIARLKTPEGRVTVPGFYDDVADLSEDERAGIGQLTFDEPAYLEALGVPATFGEAGYSTLERQWARPTLDVNGIFGGYMGEGAKTIIPAAAGAKISMRLVPNQDPDKIADAFEAYIKELVPDTVRCRVVRHAGARATVVPLESDYMAAARRAIKAGFGVKPVMIRAGGTIPVVEVFKRKLGLDTLLLGFGQLDDGAHSPNESFRLVDFHHGCLSAAHLLDELAAM